MHSCLHLETKIVFFIYFLILMFLWNEVNYFKGSKWKIKKSRSCRVKILKPLHPRITVSSTDSKTVKSFWSYLQTPMLKRFKVSFGTIQNLFCYFTKSEWRNPSFKHPKTDLEVYHKDVFNKTFLFQYQSFCLCLSLSQLSPIFLTCCF